MIPVDQYLRDCPIGYKLHFWDGWLDEESAQVGNKEYFSHSTTEPELGVYGMWISDASPKVQKLKRRRKERIFNWFVKLTWEE